MNHQLELLVGIKLETNNLVAMKHRFLSWEEIIGQINSENLEEIVCDQPFFTCDT